MPCFDEQNKKLIILCWCPLICFQFLVYERTLKFKKPLNYSCLLSLDTETSHKKKNKQGKNTGENREKSES